MMDPNLSLNDNESLQNKVDITLPVTDTNPFVTSESNELDPTMIAFSNECNLPSLPKTNDYSLKNMEFSILKKSLEFSPKIDRTIPKITIKQIPKLPSESSSGTDEPQTISQSFGSSATALAYRQPLKITISKSNPENSNSSPKIIKSSLQEVRDEDEVDADSGSVENHDDSTPEPVRPNVLKSSGVIIQKKFLNHDRECLSPKIIIKSIPLSPNSMSMHNSNDSTNSQSQNHSLSSGTSESFSDNSTCSTQNFSNSGGHELLLMAISNTTTSTTTTATNVANTELTANASFNDIVENNHHLKNEPLVQDNCTQREDFNIDSYSESTSKCENFSFAAKCNNDELEKVDAAAVLETATDAITVSAIDDFKAEHLNSVGLRDSEIGVERSEIDSATVAETEIEKVKEEAETKEEMLEEEAEQKEVHLSEISKTEATASAEIAEIAAVRAEPAEPSLDNFEKLPIVTNGTHDIVQKNDEESGELKPETETLDSELNATYFFQTPKKRGRPRKYPIVKKGEQGVASKNTNTGRSSIATRNASDKMSKTGENESLENDGIGENEGSKPNRLSVGRKGRKGFAKTPKVVKTPKTTTPKRPKKAKSPEIPVTPITSSLWDNSQLSASAFDDDTMTSMDSTLQQLNEDSQMSVDLGTSGVIRNKKLKIEHYDFSRTVVRVDQIIEYSWNGGGPFMLQEQIAQYLGVKSFKRKYPNITRRAVDMRERDYIREKSMVSEALCDMGLTAVLSADILDIMCTDFQEKYEEYRRYLREKQVKDLTNRQKLFNASTNKSDLRDHAVRSAHCWNRQLLREKSQKRAFYMDLQTYTIHRPGRNMFPKAKTDSSIGHYPLALVPGQFTDYYKAYTPNELNFLPVNTVRFGPGFIRKPESPTATLAESALAVPSTQTSNAPQSSNGANTSQKSATANNHTAITLTPQNVNIYNNRKPISRHDLNSLYNKNGVSTPASTAPKVPNETSASGNLRRQSPIAQQNNSDSSGSDSSSSSDSDDDSSDSDDDDEDDDDENENDDDDDDENDDGDGDNNSNCSSQDND